MRRDGIHFSKGEAASAWVRLTSVSGICRQRSYLVKMSHKGFRETHLQSPSVSWLPLLFSSCACVCGREEISTGRFCCRHCCIFADVVLLLRRPRFVSHAGRCGTCLSASSAPALHPRGERSEGTFSLTRNTRSSRVCKAKIPFNRAVSAKTLVPFHDRKVGISLIFCPSV